MIEFRITDWGGKVSIAVYEVGADNDYENILEIKHTSSMDEAFEFIKNNENKSRPDRKTGCRILEYVEENGVFSQISGTCPPEGFEGCTRICPSCGKEQRCPYLFYKEPEVATKSEGSE